MVIEKLMRHPRKLASDPIVSRLRSLMPEDPPFQAEKAGLSSYRANGRLLRTRFVSDNARILGFTRPCGHGESGYCDTCS